jgi:uncharacterized membrane protein
MSSNRSISTALAQIWLPLFVLLLFGVYHGCITFENHFQFRTYAFDLGYYNHTVHEFGHLRLGEHVLENSIYWHTWGDHFEPVLMLIGPLTHFFGNYTLLIVQWAAILIGAIGTYRYFQFRSEDKWLPLIAMTQFLAIWGNSSALSFDFHAAVLGAMVVPWMLLHFQRRDRWRLALSVLLLVACGEKVSFWGIFIFLGLALLELRQRRQMLWALGASAFCLAWTFVSLKYVIPVFIRPGKTYQHFDFHVMGENNAEVIRTILTHPGKAFRLLYESHTPEEKLSRMLKVELWKMIALSGGIAFLRRPQYLLMMLPVLLTKLYNDASIRWGINAHYSIEFVPILCIAAYEWIKDIRLTAWRRMAAILMLALTLTASLVSLFTRYQLHYRWENTNVFTPGHWVRWEYDIRNLQYAVSIVPPDVPVTASDRLVPQIAPRDKIYFFPHVADAEYAVVQLSLDTYPMSEEKCRQRYQEMQDSGEWEEVWHAPEVGVLRRVHR